MLIGNATTDENGIWVLNWTIPSNMELGSHDIEVYAPEQGWYRSGVANQTLWVAHHSAISLSANGGDATRGFDWFISGRLYDSDVVGLPGIANAEVQVALDGASIATLTTDENGISVCSSRSICPVHAAITSSQFSTWAIPLGWAVKTSDSHNLG